MFDQEHYSDYTNSWPFSSTNTTNETCSTAVTRLGAVTEEQTRSVVERVIWSILLILIILASLIGNVLVLVCVYLHHRIREENASLFILNLSVVDMISAIVVMVSSLHALASDKWLMGPAWCDIVCGTNYMLIIVNMFTLCYVSLDRYIAVKHALHYHARVTRTRIYILLGFAWCLGICFGLVPILYHWIIFDYWEAVCAIAWHEDREHVLLFVIVGFSLCFVLPSAVLIIAYCKVMKIALEHNKIHQKNADIQANAANRKDVTTKFVRQTSTHEHSRNQHSRDDSAAHNENMAKLSDALNTTCLPPVSPEDTDSQRKTICQPTDSCLRTEHDSPKVHFQDHLTELTARSGGNLLCEIDVDHRLESFDCRSNVTTSMQPIEHGNNHNSTQPLKHHTPPASCVDENPVIQTTHTTSILVQLPEHSNENADKSDQDFLAKQTDACSQKSANNERSQLGGGENYGKGETLSQRSDNLSLSSNEVYEGMIDTSLTTSFFSNPTTQQKTQGLDNHGQLKIQQAIKKLDSQKLKIADQTTQMVNQMGLTNDRSVTRNPTPVNMPRTDRRILEYRENNQNVIDTRHLPRPSNANNKRKTAASNKAAKSLLLVVVAYFICMAPFSVTKLCKVVFLEDILPDYINLVASIFQYCSSAINPLIYGIFRKDFRRAFVLLANRFLGKSGTTNANMSDAQSTVY